MTRDSTSRASVAQILLWYDQAEIVLLKISRFEYALAVTSGAENALPTEYVAASMGLSFLADYQEGKFDLRYALAHANLRRYWKFEFDGYQSEVVLKKIKKSDEAVGSSVPDSGFFSREHDEIDVVNFVVPDTEEKFNIDGSWELGEFSKFYGQVEDIYYICTDLRRFQDRRTSSNTKEVIKQAFDRPWRGGGSYVAFYDKIANDNLPTAKLRVSGIKYNSPGYVSIRAKRAGFDDMLALLRAYADDVVGVKKAHNKLQQYMSANKLLKRHATVRVSSEINTRVSEYGRALSNKLPGVSFESLKEMSDGREVVAAKVLLSIFRRIERLYRYFEQGRVAYEGFAPDAMADTLA
jgi:hypothetical protein